VSDAELSVTAKDRGYLKLLPTQWLWRAMLPIALLVLLFGFAVVDQSVLSPASNSIPDLVLSDDSVGSVVVYRGDPSLPSRFYQTNEIFLCPGQGPRSVSVADFAGDGWRHGNRP
jgi:hypothetical protein